MEELCRIENVAQRINYTTYLGANSLVIEISDIHNYIEFETFLMEELAYNIIAITCWHMTSVLYKEIYDVPIFVFLVLVV